MSVLERSSHRGTLSPCACREQRAAYRTHHRCGEFLPRHAHRRAFAAVVLAGRYEEAGDTGRHIVEAGDVVVHQAWECHLDRVERSGADVLVLDLGNMVLPFVHARLSDPDRIVRYAETDLLVALDDLAASAVPRAPRPLDWPDHLAVALRTDPSLSITDWARAQNLHPGSVSRGFRQVFGIAPQAFRLAQRTLRAVEVIRASRLSLSAVAAECQFADQSHMSRAILQRTEMTPSMLRNS